MVGPGNDTGVTYIVLPGQPHMVQVNMAFLENAAGHLQDIVHLCFHIIGSSEEGSNVNTQSRRVRRNAQAVLDELLPIITSAHESTWNIPLEEENVQH